MSGYYYGSTFGNQRQPLPKPYGSTAPYAGTRPAGQQPPLPSFPGGVPPNYVPGYQPTMPTNPGRIGIDSAFPPAGGGGGGGGSSGPPAIDYSNDPILARIRALAQESIRHAEADALAGRTRLAIGFGDPELAKQLKLSNDVQKQAANNTFGTLQELNRGLTRRNVFDITGRLSNQANLFYSSERGRQLALSGEQFLRDRSVAQNAVQDKLTSISQALAAAKMQAQMQIIQAEQEAYMRALQQAYYASGVG
jgi:hypothetical protein